MSVTHSQSQTEQRHSEQKHFLGDTENSTQNTEQQCNADREMRVSQQTGYNVTNSDIKSAQSISISLQGNEESI